MMEVYVYGHDRCQSHLSMSWLVCACRHYNFSWSDNHFFWQYSVIHFGRCILAPCGAHKWFEVQKGRKTLLSVRTSTTAVKVVIFLVKLRFLFPLLRAIRCPRHETGSGKKKGSRIGNDRAKLHELALDPIHSWSTAADSCPPSDFSDRPPISISMTTARKWLTWNRSTKRLKNLLWLHWILIWGQNCFEMYHWALGCSEKFHFGQFKN